MEENNYLKAYKEVVEILKYVPEESVNKIPKKMLEMFNNNMDNTYEFKVDISKDFDEQNLLEETKAIFANIFRDYWATSYQKERIEACLLFKKSVHFFLSIFYFCFKLRF